jgi:hypothetical protein
MMGKLRRVYEVGTDPPISGSTGHNLAGLAFSFFFFCVSFFFKGMLGFFLGARFLLIFFFAHDILLDKT